MSNLHLNKSCNEVLQRKSLQILIKKEHIPTNVDLLLARNEEHAASGDTTGSYQNFLSILLTLSDENSQKNLFLANFRGLVCRLLNPKSNNKVD